MVSNLHVLGKEYEILFSPFFLISASIYFPLSSFPSLFPFSSSPSLLLRLSLQSLKLLLSLPEAPDGDAAAL